MFWRRSQKKLTPQQKEAITEAVTDILNSVTDKFSPPNILKNDGAWMCALSHEQEDEFGAWYFGHRREILTYVQKRILESI